MSTTTVQTLIAAINRGIEGFAKCDWTHENWSLGRDEHGQPVYCSGGHSDTCETCREADADAKSAQEYGHEALAEINAAFNVYKVAGLVRNARDCEQKWGDAPAWRDALRLAEAAVSAADSETRTYRIRFATSEKFWSESDALQYANGAAERFNGNGTRGFTAGDLFAELTVPADEANALEAMLDDDDLVVSYSSF